MKEIRSAMLRYGLALGSFALILLLSYVLRRFFSINLDVTPLIILLMIASTWYGGRGPGLLVAIAFEIVLDYFSPVPPFSLRFAIIFFNRMVLFGALVIFVSARRSAEKRLKEQREWLQVTLSSIGDAVIATDINGFVSFLNSTAESLTGWTLSEAAHKPFDEVFHIINEETHARVESPFSIVKREGTVVGLANHSLLITKAGKEIPIEDSGAPIKDSAGKMIGVIVVFHDVSERRQVELEREQSLKREQAARNQAEAANHLKDDFLATVSHELRTPLNAMLGWAGMLRAGNLDQTMANRALETIERNGWLQAQLIEDILDVSRIITGKLRLTVQPVNLPAVIEATLEVIRPAADAKEIDLQVRLDSRISPISGDPNRLQQIVWNLLSNAVKFTPAGGNVQVRLEQVNSHVEITVRDSGKGIREDFLPYVFDRFRQGDSTTTRSFGGLGLGLSIVRHLVELHGGSVSVYSKGEEEGATFTVRLPIRLTPESARFSRAETGLVETLATKKRAANEGAMLEGTKILVVEDEIDARELAILFLEQQQAEVTAVASAEEALKILSWLKPDIIVSDIQMPGEDGYSLIRKVRAMEQDGDRKVPAIALTAHAREEDRLKSLEAGFQSHITKPVEPDELIAMIQRLAGKSPEQKKEER
jgi:PAS domain S-box-containing protein